MVARSEGTAGAMKGSQAIRGDSPRDLAGARGVSRLGLCFQAAAGSVLIGRCALVLLALHALLLALSIPRNAVTFDEFAHLPVGMSYWHLGEFWGYHHNPPLVRALSLHFPRCSAGCPLITRTTAMRRETAGRNGDWLASSWT